MKPSFAISESKNQVKSKRYGMVIDCRNGTVPILRNTKAYVANAQYFTENHINQLTVERHEQHVSNLYPELQNFQLLVSRYDASFNFSKFIKKLGM